MRRYDRPNDPPVPDGRVIARFEHALRGYGRKIEADSPDMMVDLFLIQHILIYQDKDTGWLNLPLRYLAKKGRMNERRLKAALMRLAVWGFVEEHPDNLHYRNRLSKRVRILLRVETVAKRAPSELERRVAEKVIKSGDPMSYRLPGDKMGFMTLEKAREINLTCYYLRPRA